MKKVLLLEDNLSMIEGLVFSLEKHDFEVTVARTVKEAKEFFSRNAYQIAVLDLMLTFIVTVISVLGPLKRIKSRGISEVVGSL